MDTPDPQCLGAAAVLTKHTLNKTQQEQGREKSRGRKCGRKVCSFDCHLRIPHLITLTKTKVLETAFKRPLSGFGRTGRIPRERTMLTSEHRDRSVLTDTTSTFCSTAANQPRSPGLTTVRDGDTGEQHVHSCT